VENILCETLPIFCIFPGPRKSGGSSGDYHTTTLKVTDSGVVSDLSRFAARVASSMENALHFIALIFYYYCYTCSIRKSLNLKEFLGNFYLLAFPEWSTALFRRLNRTISGLGG